MTLLTKGKYMKISTYTGTVLSIANSFSETPKVSNRVVSKSSYGYNLDDIALDGVDYPDYDKHFDVYYHVSDDGSTYYNSARIINDDETIIPPSFQELKTNAMTLIAPLYGKVDPSDVTYALHLITNPVWIHKAYIENSGDIAAAQRSNLNVHWADILKDA